MKPMIPVKRGHSWLDIVWIVAAIVLLVPFMIHLAGIVIDFVASIELR